MSAEHSTSRRDVFIASFRELQQSLEARRKRYLLLFIINCALALAVLFLGIFYPRESLEWMAAKLQRSEPVADAEVASFIFFCILCGIMLVAAPFVSYRGGFREKNSLRNLALLRVCELMGNSVPGSSAIALAPVAAGSMLFPRDAGIAERHGICGDTPHMKYVLQEMAVASLQQGDRASVFRGIFILCTPKTRRHPHLHDDRRVVVINDGKHTPESLIARGWQRAITLARPRLQALGLGSIASADSAQAAMISESEIEELHALATRAQNMQSPRTRSDSRIWGDLAYILIKLKEALTSGFARQPIEAERAYDAQFCRPPHMHRRLHDKTVTQNVFLGVSAFQGKLVVALEGPDFLTGQLSLFGALLSEEATLLLYDLVSWLDGIEIK